MYVNVALLKETQSDERRVALVPSVVPKLIVLGAKLHMQTGAGDAIKLADAALIGANDVVNPAARTDKSSPIFGMPILDADKAKKAYVVKRGQGKGCAGIVDALFYSGNCDMVYGDAAAVLTKMIEAVRGLSLKVVA
jgi:NAD/NADP transhydrogenase alpha subunit